MGLGLADRYRGPYYVRYPDGHRTVGMTRDTAENYRRIFGGTIHCENGAIPPERPPWGSILAIGMILVACYVFCALMP